MRPRTSTTGQSRQVLIKVGAFAGLFLAGDVASQKIVQYRKTRKADTRVDMEKLTLTATWATLFGGPVVYKWYKYLDAEKGFKKSWIGRKISIGPISGTMRLPRGLILGKIVADLLFDVPFYGFYLYAQKIHENSRIHKLSNPQIYLEPFRKGYFSHFAKVYEKDVYFWTPANFINFFLIPERFRILYVSLATAGWACLLPILCREGCHH